MVDYSKLSNNDLIALSNGDYKALSDEGLKLLAGNTVLNKKGINLTPSGIANNIGATIGAGLAAPIVAAKEGKTLKESYDTANKRASQARENDKIGKVQDFLTDLAVYGTIPQIRGTSTLGKAGAFAGNAAIQGGLPGLLEGIKAGENPLAGAGMGTSVAAGLQAIPIIGKGLGKAAQLAPIATKTIGRIKPETLKQVVKPNSKALDLTEDEAQRLLMNTTERVQHDYQNLLDKAGEKVQEATLRLPENRGVPASTLKNILNDIYEGYSTSGDKALNVAYNKAGKIYNQITDLIDKASDLQEVGNVSAPKLNDLIKNVKSFNIKWDDPNAQTVNTILKQIYGNYTRRLSNLSPELKAANKEFSKLANFEDNEGVRRILQPAKEGDLDIPSSALRNYNSTITKGNSNRNIQDLENILVENGSQPFLNDIDDVNAAMDLLNIKSTGDSAKANILTELTKPVLKAARWVNQKGIPEKVKQLNNNAAGLRELLSRITIPTASMGAAKTLYGGISYDEY